MVVDTSVWIDFLNGRDTPKAGFLARALEDGDLVLVPGLVMTEVLQGISSDADAARVAELLMNLPVPPEPDEYDIALAASLFRKCRARGTTPRSTIDCLIAQTCLALDLPVLAQDRDYEVIAQVSPLRIVKVPAA